MSPDEICIVNAASEIGFKFLGEKKNICNIEING